MQRTAKRSVSTQHPFVVDLHEAAHHRTTVVDRDRFHTWDLTAERVLFELLAPLDRHAAENE